MFKCNYPCKKDNDKPKKKDRLTVHLSYEQAVACQAIADDYYMRRQLYSYAVEDRKPIVSVCTWVDKRDGTQESNVEQVASLAGAINAVRTMTALGCTATVRIEHRDYE